MLISGGDGLTLAPKLFESILRGLREIPHIEIIRIGSRVPVFLPQRIDDELCAMLEKYHPLWINLHFNHPNEITPEVSRAVDKLTKAGLPVGNQSVLLAGVNDCVHIQRALVHRLVENRIRPYYLYQCDLVEGSGHFRTPVGKGLEIMEGLRGHTSGYAVPTYVIDAPGGGGKIPVMPNYLISYSDHKVVLRNYEGYITTYEEPPTYQQHDKAACAVLLPRATRARPVRRPRPARRASGCGSSRGASRRSTSAATSSSTASRTRASGSRTGSARSRAARAGSLPVLEAGDVLDPGERAATDTNAGIVEPGDLLSEEQRSGVGAGADARVRPRRGAAAARRRADRLRPRRAALDRGGPNARLTPGPHPRPAGRARGGTR